jgi:hypothetical protein
VDEIWGCPEGFPVDVVLREVVVSADGDRSTVHGCYASAPSPLAAAGIGLGPISTVADNCPLGFRSFPIAHKHPDTWYVCLDLSSPFRNQYSIRPDCSNGETLLCLEEAGPPTDLRPPPFPTYIVNVHNAGLHYLGSEELKPDWSPCTLTLPTGTTFGDEARCRMRGKSSAALFPKLSLSLDLGVDAVVHRDLPRENDYVLHGPYSDKSLVRNYAIGRLARHLARTWQPRYEYVSLAIVDEPEPVADPTTRFAGAYLLTEKIKLHADRVSGPAIFKRDKYEPDDVVIPAVTYMGPLPYNLTWHDLADDAPTADLADRVAAIAQADASLDLATLLPLLDVESFATYLATRLISMDIDALTYSQYFSFDPDTLQVRAGPVWDNNLGMGNTGHANADTEPTTAVGANNVLSPRDAFVYRTLYKHPRFRCSVRRVLDRLADTAVLDDLFPAKDDLTDLATMNFIRWPIANTWIWPNQRVRGSWSAEFDYVRAFLPARVEYLRTGEPDFAFDPAVDCPLAPVRLGEVGRTFIEVVHVGTPASPVDTSSFRFGGRLLGHATLSPGDVLLLNRTEFTGSSLRDDFAFLLDEVPSRPSGEPPACTARTLVRDAAGDWAYSAVVGGTPGVLDTSVVDDCAPLPGDGLAINEVGTTFVELRNDRSDDTVDLSRFTLGSLPLSGTLAPGAIVSVPYTLNATAPPSRLLLTDGTLFLDDFDIDPFPPSLSLATTLPRPRFAPRVNLAVPTPGVANGPSVATGSGRFDRVSLSTICVASDAASPLSLDGWSVGGVGDFVFPPGTKTPACVTESGTGAPTGYTAVGPFLGKVKRSGERLTLRDETGARSDVVSLPAMDDDETLYRDPTTLSWSFAAPPFVSAGFVDEGATGECPDAAACRAVCAVPVECVCAAGLETLARCDDGSSGPEPSPEGPGLGGPSSGDQSTSTGGSGGDTIALFVGVSVAVGLCVAVLIFLLLRRRRGRGRHAGNRRGAGAPSELTSPSRTRSRHASISRSRTQSSSRLHGGSSTAATDSLYTASPVVPTVGGSIYAADSVSARYRADSALVPPTTASPAVSIRVGVPASDDAAPAPPTDDVPPPPPDDDVPPASVQCPTCLDFYATLDDLEKHKERRGH